MDPVLLSISSDTTILCLVTLDCILVVVERTNVLLVYCVSFTEFCDHECFSMIRLLVSQCSVDMGITERVNLFVAVSGMQNTA